MLRIARLRTADRVAGRRVGGQAFSSMATADRISPRSHAWRIGSRAVESRALYVSISSRSLWTSGIIGPSPGRSGHPGGPLRRVARARGRPSLQFRRTLLAQVGREAGLPTLVDAQPQVPGLLGDPFAAVADGAFAHDAGSVAGGFGSMYVNPASISTSCPPCSMSLPWSTAPPGCAASFRAALAFTCPPMRVAPSTISNV